jgi:hypothetical protein
MRDFRKQKRNKFYFYAFALILVVFDVMIISSLFDLMKKNREVRANKDEALLELTRLEERERSIKKKIEAIATPFGTEEAIREKFGFKKPGEGEVIITEREEEGEATEKKSFLHFLKSLF